MPRENRDNRQELMVWWGKGLQRKKQSVLSPELAETPSYHQTNWTQIISVPWFIYKSFL